MPRREFSVRNDYDVLISSNRHTITPAGWLHEQRNLKAKIDTTGNLLEKDSIITTEYGISRYERIKNFNFNDGDSYITKSKQVWDEVRAKWDELATKNRFLTLKGTADKDQLFLPLFSYAEKFAYPEDKTDFKLPSNAELKDNVSEKVQAYLK